MDSFDQCPFLKMSLVEMPTDIDFDEEPDLVEWVLKTEVSVSDNDKTSTIHREFVWVVTNL